MRPFGLVCNFPLQSSPSSSSFFSFLFAWELGHSFAAYSGGGHMEARPIPTSRPRKRLLFDRRYGWVYDEWKDPSEEAFAGGRGMFSIVPITKSFLKMASQLVIAMAASVVRALENPNQFSPQALRANLSNQLQRLVCCMQKPNLKLLTFHGDSRQKSM